MFQPSHIVYQSKNVENMRSEANLLGRSSSEQNDIPESLRQQNNKTPNKRTEDSVASNRKSSVSETEYFRRFKNITVRKDRIPSDKSLIVDNKRTSADSIKGLQDEEEDGREDESYEGEEIEEQLDQHQNLSLRESSPSFSYHGSDEERLLSEKRKIRNEVSNSGEEEQTSEEEQNVTDEGQKEEEDRIDTDKCGTRCKERNSMYSVESLQDEKEDEIEVESIEDEEDLNLREESLSLSYDDSDEEGLLVEGKEINKEISDSGEEQENQEEQCLVHELDRIESDEDREEEEADVHNIDPSEESLKSLSHTSEEIKLLSDTELLLQSAVATENSTIPLESTVAIEASSTLIHALDLYSSSALESAQFIRTTYSFPLLNKSETLIKVLKQKKPETKSPLRKKKSHDNIPNFSGRRKSIPFFKKGRLSKRRKKVPFYYCGKLCRDKDFRDKDIVTVLSPNEMRNNLAKKSPVNGNLYDYGFKKLRGKLNTGTSTLVETAQLGERKRSVSKAKSVLENLKEGSSKNKPSATKNLEVPIIKNRNIINSDESNIESDTTELLSDYYQRRENNLNEQEPKLRTSKKRKSLISESEMTTERLNIKQTRVEFQTVRDKFKKIECDPVSHCFVSRVENSEAKEVERMRASAEDDSISLCQSFHIQKFFDFGKDSLEAGISFKDFEETSDSIAEERLIFERTKEERAGREDEELILLSDGSKTPKRSFTRSRNISRISSRMENKADRRIIDDSNVIILSSEDDQSPPKKQEFKQERLSTAPLDESNTKSKMSLRVRPTTDHSFGWKVKKYIVEK